MESKPVPPKPGNIPSSEFPIFSDEKIDEQTERVSEVFRETSAEKEKPKEQLTKTDRKVESLKKLVSLDSTNENDRLQNIDNYLNSIDSDLLNDLEIFQKIYEFCCFDDSNKYANRFFRRRDFSKIINRLFSENKLVNSEIVKFLILHTTAYKSIDFPPKLLSELFKDKEVLFKYTDQVFLERNEI